MKSAAAWLIAGLLALAPFAATAEGGLAAETRWADPAHVRLDVEFPGDGYQASWELFRCDCGDLLVRSELSAPGEVDKGEALLVQGRVVLSRGFGEQQAELGASLDAPALMMQLALRLLERAEPNGPPAVTGAAEVAVEDAINPIHLESWSAVGGFQAPWSVSGKIEPLDATRRRFDLRFRFRVGAGSESQEAAMRLKGQADYAPLPFPVDAASALAGWRLDWREEADPAIPAAAGAETLAGLRKLLKESPQ